jgi:hypothetical protein
VKNATAGLEPAVSSLDIGAMCSDSQLALIVKWDTPSLKDSSNVNCLTLKHVPTIGSGSMLCGQARNRHNFPSLENPACAALYAEPIHEQSDIRRFGETGLHFPLK